MNLVIIDYGSGNLRSVENAFKNSVKTNKLNFTIQVTNELELISKADHLVLPGVGSFPDCKRGLEDVKGCLLYTSPSPRDVEESRMPSSA